MTDAECLEIEKSVWGYLLRCIFDDLAITAYETSDALQYLQKEQIDELQKEDGKLKSILEEIKDINEEVWLFDGRIIRLKDKK